jgi:hypothetical protein
MKKLFVCIFTLLVTTAYSQARDFALTGTYSKNFMSGGAVDMYGLNMEIFITDNLSLNYSFAVGNRNNFSYYHSPAGLIGGISVFLNVTDQNDQSSDDEESSTSMKYGGAVLVMLLPEGINYYFPLSQYVTIGAYCNPLGYDFFRDNDASFSSSLGLKFMYHLNEHFILVPQIGMSFFYTNHDPTVFNLGLSIGYKL